MQAKCKVKGCNRTAIPGRSPHGLCLQHEQELAMGTLLKKCPVDGCPNTYNPKKNKNGLCPECEAFLNKLIWFLPRLETQERVDRPHLILPGQYKPPNNIGALIKNINRKL